VLEQIKAKKERYEKEHRRRDGRNAISTEFNAATTPHKPLWLLISSLRIVGDSYIGRKGHNGKRATDCGRGLVL
jgi:hypothetical protein